MKKYLVITAILLASCTANKSLDDPSARNSALMEAMVVTANPYATKAGADALRSGGSAVDAAIAIQSVLSLVEPQSSGLGGGGFMVFFDNQTKRVSVYDGRETAPASVTPDLFLDDEGEPLQFIAAKTSGISTGVPGMVSMLHLAHSDHGRLAWLDNFDTAKQLARDGFEISPRLHGTIERFGKYIPSTIEEGPVDAYNYFFNGEGQPHPVGYLLKNPAYAQSLVQIANDPRAFYEGDIADQIVQQTSSLPRASGMTTEDLANYSATRRDALCAPYRELSLCGPPPPSSWLAIGMTMGLLERSPGFSNDGAEDAYNWKLFAEAQRLAYVDRDQYVADAEYVEVPVAGMLHPEYLDERAKLISAEEVIESVSPGDPWAFQQGIAKANGLDQTYDVAGTTHFVVVDLQGNVVSVTASVESVFGSTRMAGGIFLNNQLTDFSFKSQDEQGNKIANSVEPGKRPRSSMSPTIVLDENGEFVMATGSPGGNSIIAYTAKTLVGVLDWALTPQQAIDLPNMIARGDKVRIEQQRASDTLIAGLRSFGYEVDESGGENSGLSVVVRGSDGKLIGGVDSRREGVVEVVVP
ncbi:MAG: gamma-glutamyltransferase family protein [Acidiferrobacterales bacterium]|nr:gamma-glutamyltransferase family protein [Acidiferrobacterales bacterium]